MRSREHDAERATATERPARSWTEAPELRGLSRPDGSKRHGIRLSTKIVSAKDGVTPLPLSRETLVSSVAGQVPVLHQREGGDVTLIAVSAEAQTHP